MPFYCQIIYIEDVGLPHPIPNLFAYPFEKSILAI